MRGKYSFEQHALVNLATTGVGCELVNFVHIIMEFTSCRTMEYKINVGGSTSLISVQEVTSYHSVV